MRHFHSRIILAGLTIGVLLSVTLFAQSGRKQKKPEPQPPPQGINQPEARTQAEPVAEAEAQPADQARNDKDKITKHALVMSGLPDMNVSLYLTDIARAACAQELKRLVRTLAVSDSSNQTRGDAMEAAKKDDQLYVIFLEIDAMMGGGMINGLDLRYTVFEPKTGKPVATGSGVPRAPRVGGGSIPIGANSVQVRMDWAGRDIAEQVVSRLKWRAGL